MQRQSDSRGLDDLLREAIARSGAGRLAVAFSGGGDSTALLHALAGLAPARDRGLRAVHVNHRLHPDASRWVDRCERFCAQQRVPLIVVGCEVDRRSGLGLEGAAREARYTALAAELRPGEWLATAQHRQDQAETVLLRLLRASGGAALAGMRATRPLGPGTLWRPLLDCPRALLLEHLRHHQLDWIDDPSNDDPHHARNWLRRELLPLLRQRWPRLDQSLATSAALLAADADLIARLADEALVRCRDAADGTLDLARYTQLDPTLRNHVLRRWLDGAGADPLPFHLHARVERELVGAAADAQPQLSYAGTTLRRHRQRLHIDTTPVAIPTAWVLPWDGSGILDLPGNCGHLQFSTAWDGGPLLVGCRLGGERIRLPGRTHRSSVKNLLRELGIPAWQRQRLPLLWGAGGQLLAVGDSILSDELDQWLQRSGASYRWDRPG